jgi:hypothetical protein
VAGSLRELKQTDIERSLRYNSPDCRVAERKNDGVRNLERVQKLETVGSNPRDTAGTQPIRV